MVAEDAFVHAAEGMTAGNSRASPRLIRSVKKGFSLSVQVAVKLLEVSGKQVISEETVRHKNSR